MQGAAAECCFAVRVRPGRIFDPGGRVYTQKKDGTLHPTRPAGETSAPAGSQNGGAPFRGHRLMESRSNDYHITRMSYTSASPPPVSGVFSTPFRPQKRSSVSMKIVYCDPSATRNTLKA